MNVLADIEGLGVFKTMGVRAENMEDVLWKKGAPIVWRTRAEQFDKEGAYLGSDSITPWAPLKRKLPKGVVSRVNGRFAARKILNRTGRMRRAMTSHSAPATVEVTRDTLVFRSHIPYEQYHQEGTSRMVARPITFDKPAAQEELMRELVAYVAAGADPEQAERIRRGA